MVDVSHEPRWGRISEAAGEDPYLNSVMAAARVKAAQGRDYAAKDKVVTSVKHYAAYGQPEAGRDYNTTDMSEQRLRNLYLPPFKAAIDAGSDTAMCSFNAINGVPGCANKRLETDILKNEWNWDGFIESDYTAVAELLNHGTAESAADAGAQALMAGTDSEMVSTFIRDNGKQLLEDGKITMARLDDAVRRILRIKFRAGLFDNPYVDPAKAEAAQELPDALAAARKAAGRSMVLLENDGKVLPLDPSKKTAVIGPLADNGKDMVGPWWGRGDDSKKVTVLEGIRAPEPGRDVRRGLQAPRQRAARLRRVGGLPGRPTSPRRSPSPRRRTRSCSRSARRGRTAARPTSRSVLDLPGNQEKLIAGDQGDGQAVRGRAVQRPSAHARRRRRAWRRRSSRRGSRACRPATRSPTWCSARSTRAASCPCRSRAGSARCRSTTTTSPTGRPCDPGVKWNSRYRDIKSCDPQYVFGYGLSYSEFQVSNLRLSATSVNAEREDRRVDGRQERRRPDR